MDNLAIIYIRLIGQNGEGKYEYEVYLSDSPESAWADDWAEQCPAAVGNMPPDEDAISSLKTMISPYKLFCAQDNTCYSMQDVSDGIFALCFYMDGFKLLFKIMYGDNYIVTKNKLQELDFEFYDRA